MKWSYGITTVPSRFDELLPRTLHSLCDAGFDSPHVFIDGGGVVDTANIQNTYGLETTTRSTAVLTAGNWVLSLYELYYRNPQADRYAVFQDDFVTYRNLREYLEACTYPDKGYWNLYTFPQNHERRPNDEPGWFESNQKGKGAVALVFNRRAVITLLTANHLAERPQTPRRGHRSIDGGIVDSMRKAGWREYVHNPSLVQHTGLVSSMGNRRHKLAPEWYGEGFDAMELLS